MIQTTSAEQKMRMHLRMLYSKTYTDFVLASSRDAWSDDAASFALVESFDERRLAFERQQRVQSLVQHLRRQAQPLWESIGEDRLIDVVRAFADSAEFWQERGRTMLENLCLFVQSPGVQRPSRGLRDLARLVGVVSGLSSRPGATSPWRDALPAPEALRLDGVVASEAFVTCHDLVDEEGRVRLGAARSSSCLVFVACFGDRSSLVGSIDGSST